MFRSKTPSFVESQSSKDSSMHDEYEWDETLMDDTDEEI